MHAFLSASGGNLAKNDLAGHQEHTMRLLAAFRAISGYRLAKYVSKNILFQIKAPETAAGLLPAEADVNSRDDVLQSILQQLAAEDCSRGLQQ